MTILIATLFSAFASFLVSIYFFWRWVRQQPRNNSALAWALGFLVYSVTHGLSGYIHSGLYQISASQYDLIRSIRAILNNLFFMFIFWGTVRLISRRSMIVYGMTILGFILASIPVFIRNMIFSSNTDYIRFLAYGIYLPMGIIFMGIYLVLYGILIAESVEKRRGVLFIIFSWAIYIIISILLPFWYDEHLDYWYIGRTVSTLILLIGFIIMEKEARQAFVHLEEDKKSPHHFK